MTCRGRWLPIVLALLASLALTWLVQLAVVARGTAQFRAGIIQQAERLAQDHRKAGVLGALTALAGTDADVRATAQGDLPPDNLQTLTRLNYLFNTLSLDNMMVMAPDGEVKAYIVKNVTTTITGRNFAWRPYFSGAIAGTPTMYAALGSNSQERGFYISTPIPGVPGVANGAAPAGVVVAKLGFKEIDELVDAQASPVAVISPEGVVFASNIPSWLYQVVGSETQRAQAIENKRVNNAYGQSPPRLIALNAGNTIELEGRTLRMHAAPIAWPDPSGVWKMAGFISDEDFFGWPWRIATAGALFLLMMLVYTWQRAQRQARRKTDQVVSLLDNSREGFLSFGADLVVDSEYSRACDSMLGVPAGGREIAGLLFGRDSAQADLMREVIASALEAGNHDVRDSMLSLLPTRISRGERQLSITYRYIGGGKFMTILSDITEQQRVSRQLVLEQHHLRMVVQAVSDSRNFFETVDSFREFLAGWEPNAADEARPPLQSPRACARKAYRDVHTLKGLLGQFSFPATPSLLHEIESGLAALLDGGTEFGIPDIAASIDIAGLAKAFEQDLAALADTLGDAFLAQGRTLVLSDGMAKRLEDLSRRLVRPGEEQAAIAELRPLLVEITRLRKVRLSDALKSYEHLVMQLASRLGKHVAPLAVEGGDDIWLDPAIYKSFLQSLVHIFRNAVVHGLESPETRWENDKDEVGLIRCRCWVADSRLHLCIADDGAGMDLEELRERAAALGMPQARQLDDQAAARLVFADRNTTTVAISDLAGRGVGLGAVQTATENLGGTLDVRSATGAGTEFCFVLPLFPHGSAIDHE